MPNSTSFLKGLIVMSRRISKVLSELYSRGDRGTANAIFDALRLLARARVMLRQSVKDYERNEDDYDARVRFDVLYDLLRRD